MMPDWNELAAQEDWKPLYNAVALTVPLLLIPGDELSTDELVERLYPGSGETRRDGGRAKIARQRIYNALKALSIHQLASYARRGKTVQERKRRPGGEWFTKSRRPWVWGVWGSPNEEAKKICPTCGTVLKPGRLGSGKGLC